MNTAKFKVGDVLKVITDANQSDTHSCSKGDKVTVIKVDGTGTPYHVKDESGDTHWCANRDVVRWDGKPVKEVPAKFILQYELDEDPFELFATLPEVKARIRELAQDDSLDRDSIYVYEIKKTTKVEISTSVSIKGL